MTPLRIFLVAMFAASLPMLSRAAVINFDDLPPNSVVPVDYQGLTWGTSAEDSVPGFNGRFWAWDALDYSTPHSTPNYVFNAFGPNNLWFAFPTPVNFGGAWFAAAATNPGAAAEQVRFHDDLGNVSAWLSLSVVPQFLNASFAGSTTIYVERAGGFSTDLGNARWYTMDDVTYNIPEPSSMLLIGSGLLGLVARGVARRSSKAR